MTWRMKKLSTGLAVLAFVLLFNQSSAPAVEVLLNGGLDESTGPYAWTLTQSITGMPGAPISASEQVDLAQEWVTTPGDTPGLGIFLKPQAGNTGEYDGQNLKVNVSLTQTVNFGASAAGRTYTFSTRSFVQAATSAFITTLYPDSPSGEVPSPTQGIFELAFLNATNDVLGTPASVNLRDNTTTEAWRTQSVVAVAPPNTTKIRVTASFTDMVQSCTTACPAGQDIYLDNFTLRDGNVPGLERLAGNPDVANEGYSGNFNVISAPLFWTIEKTSQNNIQFSSASYARNDQNPSSQIGMWLRSFAGGDAKVLQTVAGVPGATYTFSGWSKWESGYNGADPFSSTQTFMTVDFLDSTQTTVLGTQSLDLRTVQINDGVWRQLTVPAAVAPVGTAFVRVSAGATAMGNSGINPQSAMFDDFSLNSSAVAGVPGDYNNNGTVDTADYVLWRKGGPLQNEVDNPGTVNAADYTEWRSRFGNTGAGTGNGNLLRGPLAANVPEPAALWVALIGLAGSLGIRSRRR
jgi:hypothetical protein